ncbi:MAG: outer membrane protein transport protein [Sulfurimonas sp.]|nr:outer membrane protein transport protein [Sulfurimonas sp.]
MSTLQKTALLSLVTSSILMAGGYKIPEVSLNAVALSAANVAHSSGADTAYYNPANMVFMKDEQTVETDFTYIGLSDINYQGMASNPYTGASGPYNLNAQRENFLVPSLHYVLGDISGARYGLSIVAPAGLSKRWNEEPAKTSAEEFTLTTVELNPTVALPIGDKFAVAIGIRAIYSKGIVKSNGTAVFPGPTPSVITRDMKGDSIEFGYNLALAYKPTSELELGLTYRSNIDLKLEGDATLTSSADAATYSGGASVSVPVPAALSAAAAYTFSSDTTVEFVYERTFWSQYKELDFNYDGALGGAGFLTGAFDDAKAKNWKDVNAYRLGITQKLDKTTLMCGVVIDETPVPSSTMGFELPDSDSISVSFGSRYQINEKLNIGLSTLYSMREDRIVSNTSLNGEFTDTTALFISAGLEYKF